MSERVILHSDMNCFYASVEMLHHPEFAGMPLAVGGLRDLQSSHVGQACRRILFEFSICIIPYVRNKINNNLQNGENITKMLLDYLRNVDIY